MSDRINRQIRLASRPAGWVTPDNFELTEAPVEEPAAGQLLVENLYLSVDPYMRGRMNDVKSYVPPFGIGEVLTGGVVGRVVASRHDGFAEGDVVTGMLGWENFTVSDGQELRKLPPVDAPLSWHLGILGMPGMTAWVGLTEIAHLKQGESVFVSAASGAVGSVAGQIARVYDCHVAGCAGSDDKVELLTSEFGYDAAFNYRSSSSLRAHCGDAVPEG